MNIYFILFLPLLQAQQSPASVNYKIHTEDEVVVGTFKVVKIEKASMDCVAKDVIGVFKDVVTPQVCLMTLDRVNSRERGLDLNKLQFYDDCIYKREQMIQGNFGVPRTTWQATAICDSQPVPHFNALNGQLVTPTVVAKARKGLVFLPTVNAGKGFKESLYNARKALQKNREQNGK